MFGAREERAGIVRNGFVARVYFQLDDGSIYEGDVDKFRYDRNEQNLTISTESDFYSLLYLTDASIENFDSVKQIKELLESGAYDCLEKIIDPDTCKPTELGAKIIRNINPDEDDAQKLYKSFKKIENKVVWFDPSKLLELGEIDGDPATIATAFFKDAIKGKWERGGPGYYDSFVFSNGTSKKIEALLKSIFEGYVDRQLGRFANDASLIKKNKIIKIISFFVTLSNLLED